MLIVAAKGREQDTKKRDGGRKQEKQTKPTLWRKKLSPKKKPIHPYISVNGI